MRSYSAEDIKSLLNTLGFSKYQSLVEDGTITGECLSVCYRWKELKFLRIKNKIHARVLLQAIKEIQHDSGTNIIPSLTMFY